MIHLLCALPCEAKPLIKHYGLRADRLDSSFRYYASDTMRLLVTGVGKENMAAGAGYLYALSGDESAIGWLNLGVAGHRERPVGQACQIHKVTDADTGQTYYPPLLFSGLLNRLGLKTVSKASLDYPGDELYDMEASAFFKTALRFSSAELVQCLKIISDNQAQGADQVQAAQVDQLMGDNLPLINDFVLQLQELQGITATIHAEPAGYQQCLQRWRFSRYQKKQLFRLLQRLQTLGLSETFFKDMPAVQQPAQVLAFMDKLLTSAPIRFEPHD